MSEKPAKPEFRPIPDAPGVFMFLPKFAILIDHTYQRVDVKPTKAQRIAEDFSWAAFGTLAISHRMEDNLYYAIDGQNRKAGADLRPDITMLPCLVYRLPNRAAEAVAFYRLNVSRTPVSSVSKFKDMLVAGYGDVMLVDETIRKTGYSVGTTSTAFTVRCVQALVSAARRNPGIFRDAWQVVSDLHAGAVIVDRVFLAVYALETHLRAKSEYSLLDDNNREALAAAGLTAIDEAVRRGQEYHGATGGRAGADGLARLLNKGRRKRKLASPMTEETSEGEAGE